MDDTLSFPTNGRIIKDAIKDAAKKPMMNFGSLVQISLAVTSAFPFSPFSTRVVKKTATAKAIKPIRIF